MALAYVKVLVIVSVVEKDEVTVMVVSPDQSPEGRSASAAGVSSRTSAAMAELKRILKARCVVLLSEGQNCVCDPIALAFWALDI